MKFMKLKSTVVSINQIRVAFSVHYPFTYKNREASALSVLLLSSTKMLHVYELDVCRLFLFRGIE